MLHQADQGLLRILHLVVRAHFPPLQAPSLSLLLMFLCTTHELFFDLFFSFRQGILRLLCTLLEHLSLTHTPQLEHFLSPQDTHLPRNRRTLLHLRMRQRSVRSRRALVRARFHPQLLPAHRLKHHVLWQCHPSRESCLLLQPRLLSLQPQKSHLLIRHLLLKRPSCPTPLLLPPHPRVFLYTRPRHRLPGAALKLISSNAHLTLFLLLVRRLSLKVCPQLFLQLSHRHSFQTSQRNSKTRPNLFHLLSRRPSLRIIPCVRLKPSPKSSSNSLTLRLSRDVPLR